MEIAYLASRYPHLSHTFIQREVKGLRSAGHTVHTFSVRPPTVDGEEADGTTSILPPRPWHAVRAAIAALRHPAAVARIARSTVAASPPGVGARVRALAYVTEGVLLWWHCRRRGVRHIHAHFANVAADVANVACRLGRAVDGDDRWSWSFTMHGPTELFDVTTFGLRRKVEQADAIMCISDFCRSQLMALTTPVRWPSIHVVHCGVDVDAIEPAPVHDEPESRRPVEVLMVGRLVPEKGPAVLVDTVAELRRRGVEVRLSFVGDGPGRADVERRVVECSLSDAVRFHGAVSPDRTADHYRRADIFCLPSFAEGVPVVLMEAMAFQLPVVTTRIAGVQELVEDGVDGVVVPPGRVDLLADAIERLAKDPVLRRELGASGRRAVARSFHIDDAAPVLEDILRDLPGVRGRR